MNEHPRRLEDGQTGRGSVNAVERVGDTVLRPVGVWSPTVHELLCHLERVEFAPAPRFLGIDAASGRERLSYLHGGVAMRPWPDYLRAPSGIAQIGRMLRRYHECVAGYRPAPNAVWRDPDVRWQDGMIVRHGDLGPWNMVWASGRLVGLIDWEFAEPGHPIDDVAQAAWYCVPLRPEARCVETGVAIGDQPARLAALCTAYDTSPRAVIDALADLQRRELARTEGLGRRGVEPWVSFLARGDADEIREEIRWLGPRAAALGAVGDR